MKSWWDGAKHSSLHTTISTLEDLAALDVGDQASRRIKQALRAGRVFFLEHRLYRSCRTGGVARELDLTESALRMWVKQYETDQGKGPPGALTSEEREELRRLRKEVKRLREKKVILKKSCGLPRE